MDRDVEKVKNIPLIQRSMSECYIKVRSDFAPASDIMHVSQKVSNVFLMRCSMLLQFIFFRISNSGNFQRITNAFVSRHDIFCEIENFQLSYY